MAKIISRLPRKSGIPLGGFGTGSVEIKPDGTLREWQILNKGTWISNDEAYCAANQKYELGPDYLPFYVRTEDRTGEVRVRRLTLDVEDYEFRKVMSPWMKCVPEIEYDGFFSGATLRYNDPTLPVGITGRFTSPFVPYDENVSSTPGFSAEFTFSNDTADTVTVSFLANIKSPVMLERDNRMLEHSRFDGENGSGIVMSTESDERLATNGSYAVFLEGDQITATTRDFRSFHDTYLYHCPYFGCSQESILYRFRDCGDLCENTTLDFPESLLSASDETINSYSNNEADALIATLCGLPSLASVRDRCARIDPTVLETRASKLRVLKSLKARLKTLVKDLENPRKHFDSAALCSSSVIPPGETKTVVVTVSWFFPNHLAKDGEFVGHYYATAFKDAREVNDSLRERRPYWLEETNKFTRTMYDSTLPEAFVEAWSGQLTTLRKSSYRTIDDRFAIWEGLGACGLHTMDITYQGSFPLMAFFPNLQKSQMTYGASFQREDGRIPHLLRSHMKGVDNQFGRVDMNPQFIMLVYRDYLYSGDLEYLRGMKAHVFAAMESMLAIDSDGDGLPDRDTEFNTYDAWKLAGTPSYIGSLYLAAFACIIEIATSLGETAYAARMSGMLRRAMDAFETKLWNGSYYDLWVDGDRRDSSCMTDQIDGEWFLRSCGLENILPKDRISAVLEVIFQTNYSEEGGLINARYPEQVDEYTAAAYKNIQGMMNWTGIEYLVASLMIHAGKLSLATQIVENVHKRYKLLGREWDHQECGDHYFRASSSYTLLLAVSGFAVDAPNKAITLNPTDELPEFTVPFGCCSCYGTLIKSHDRCEMTIASGSLPLRAVNSKTYAIIEINGVRHPTRFEDDIELTTDDHIVFAC